MRSGTERLAYSMIIVTVATMTAWILAMVLGLKPIPFLPLEFAIMAVDCVSFTCQFLWGFRIFYYV